MRHHWRRQAAAQRYAPIGTRQGTKSVSTRRPPAIESTIPQGEGAVTCDLISQTRIPTRLRCPRTTSRFGDFGSPIATRETLIARRCPTVGAGHHHESTEATRHIGRNSALQAGYVGPDAQLYRGISSDRYGTDVYLKRRAWPTPVREINARAGTGIDSSGWAKRRSVFIAETGQGERYRVATATVCC